MTHINYNGSAPALTDVIAGRVPLMFDIWHSARRYVESGDLKLIASASARAAAGAPDVPTIARDLSGRRRHRVQRHRRARRACPRRSLEKLSADIRAVVNSPEFARQDPQSRHPRYGNTPQELRAWMAQEIARWKEIAKAANIKAD